MTTAVKPKRKSKIKTGSLAFDLFLYVFLFLLSVIFVYPLYQVIICSISDPGAVSTSRGLMLLPKGIHFEAYQVVVRNKNLWTGFKNTGIYILVGVSIQYAVTLITAYPLSIKNLAGKKGIWIYFVITMYFGGGLIPFFLLISNLGWMNTIWALTVPGAINVSNVIIMRTQFSNLPDELKEAARIDGAGDMTMLFRIFLPLSGAVSAVLILFGVVGYWNMWFEPMIYTTQRKMYPIQSVLREILIDNAAISSAGRGGAQVKLTRNADKAAVNQLIKYANIVITTVPILLVYPFAQKHFVKGVMIGSLKG